jgi:hypothetical protein
LEADFQRYYRLDLREDVGGARRLWALVQGLPPDAACWREDMFTRQEEFAAAQIEVTDQWLSNLAQLLGAKRQSLPKPIRVPRPGDGRVQRAEIETDPMKIERFFNTG